MHYLCIKVVSADKNGLMIMLPVIEFTCLHLFLHFYMISWSPSVCCTSLSLPLHCGLRVSQLSSVHLFDPRGLQLPIRPHANLHQENSPFIAVFLHLRWALSARRD